MGSSDKRRNDLIEGITCAFGQCRDQFGEELRIRTADNIITVRPPSCAYGMCRLIGSHASVEESENGLEVRLRHFESSNWAWDLLGICSGTPLVTRMLF